MASERTRLDDVHRAAALLRDIGRLWGKTKVTPEERRDFVDAMVEELRIDENGIAALRTRPDFGPILAVAAMQKRGAMVGERGFEPPTSSSRTKRAAGLRHSPTPTQSTCAHPARQARAVRE